MMLIVIISIIMMMINIIITTMMVIITIIIIIWSHYIDVIMTTMAPQITSLTVVYSIDNSDADQRKHQSSASLAFVWGIHRDRWIPRTKGQLRGKCFHLVTSSWWWWFDYYMVIMIMVTLMRYHSFSKWSINISRFIYNSHVQNTENAPVYNAVRQVKT